MKTGNYPQSVTIFSKNYPQSVTWPGIITLTILHKCVEITLTIQPFLRLIQAKTIAGKEFTLLNLPFYFVQRLERELDEIMS